MKGSKILIVGAGITGATIASKLAQENSILVVERRGEVGGNCHDYLKNGILIHKYGAHIFHTDDAEVWSFVNQFATFNTYQHRVFAMIDGEEINLPFNLQSIERAFPQTLAKRIEEKLLAKYPYNSRVSILDFQEQEDEDLRFLAKYIYDNVFLNYTTKQWGISPSKVDKSVLARVPVFVGQDTRYFRNKYQGIPLGGYTKMIENMLNHKNIEVRLNSDYKHSDSNFDVIIHTGTIDEFFNYKHGVLPYRSLHFELEEHNVEYYQSAAVVNYPNNYDFTRIVEHKHFYNAEYGNITYISKEYPTTFELGKNERFYPIQNPQTQEIYNKYLAEAKALGNVHFVGRLGDYKYYDMDVSVRRGIDMANSVCR